MSQMQKAKTTSFGSTVSICAALKQRKMSVNVDFYHLQRDIHITIYLGKCLRIYVFIVVVSSVLMLLT